MAKPASAVSSLVTTRPLYIAVEGPIGVGKTTLTNLLVEHFEARGVYEEFEENPFLAKFYENRRSVAFQTQIFFLLCRFKQQQSMRQQDLFHTTLVSDYLFAKDRIFACINLDDDELALYEKIFDLINPRVKKPDLVVYLTAPLEVLFQRISNRGREYERSIEPEYLTTLAATYHDFFLHYDEAPVLKVDTAGIDVVFNLEDRLELLDRVVASIPSLGLDGRYTKDIE
jgi:deoxyguanosine kinase